nr:hypothetical protein [Tanacetum cinerariifolium]
MDSLTNNQKRKRTDGPKILTETLAKWNEINKDAKVKKTRKPYAKGSTKGCMKHKGGPKRIEGALAYDEVTRAIYGLVARINLPNYCPNAWLTASSYDSTVTCISNDDMLDIDDFLSVMVEYECSQAQGLKTAQNVSEATIKEVEVTGIPDKNFFDIDELLSDINQKGQYDAWFENKVDGFEFDFLDTEFEDYNFTLEDLGISLDPTEPVMYTSNPGTQYWQAIQWASKKQTCITGSTMEYEFVALAAVASASSSPESGPDIEPLLLAASSAISSSNSGMASFACTSASKISFLKSTGVSKRTMKDHSLPFCFYVVSTALAMRNYTKLGRIVGNLVQFLVQFIPGYGSGECTDEDQWLLMKFSELVHSLNGIYQLDGFSFVNSFRERLTTINSYLRNDCGALSGIDGYTLTPFGCRITYPKRPGNKKRMGNVLASKKQTCITGSIIEYEFVALAAAASIAISSLDSGMASFAYTLASKISSSKSTGVLKVDLSC